jgi:hypothetical protein
LARFVIALPFSLQVVSVAVLTSQGFATTVAHMITGSRKEEAYTFFLRELAALGLQPDYFMADFETAEANAARAVWPDAVIRGCLFHFLQACERNFQRLKGGRFTSTWTELAVMLRALAACRSRQLFDQQLDTMRTWLIDHALSEYERYFMSQWVGKVRLSLSF